MTKLVPIAEAFRKVLRSTYPNKPALADEIQSILWFHYHPRDPETNEPTSDAKAAFGALDVIKQAVTEQRIRLRGTLDAPPDDIDPIEVAWSGVHLFDGTLEVYERGRTVRTYRNVHCYEAEIRNLVAEPAPRPPAPTSHMRFIGDDDLAAEGVAGIGGKWPNVHQAAMALASRASGTATETSKARRIEAKISKLLETSRKTSKD